MLIPNKFLLITFFAASQYAVAQTNLKDCATLGVLAEQVAKESQSKRIEPKNTNIIRSGIKNGFQDEVLSLAESVAAMENIPLKSIGEYYTIACLLNLKGSELKGIAAHASKICQKPGSNLTELETTQCFSAFINGVARTLQEQ